MNINSSLSKTPIAVVGLSAFFADAKNIEEYWNNIVEARDSIVEVPESRWKLDDYYDADPMTPDKTYCKVGGFIPEVDFNPMEFGLPPNILEVTDASQLLSLVAARDALLDAGYGKDSPKFTKELKEKTGVILGVGGGQKLITPLISRLQYPIWKKALQASGIADEDIPPIIDKMKKAYIGWNENSFPGLLGNVISGRITNRFDLGGINSVVDAACAASLSAVKMALSELVEGRCDMMLTGGVDTDNSIFMYMSFSKTPAFSPTGKISPFSETGNGMLIGEGVGMLVLKRLADAERDGDKIYAVVKGIGSSSDGRFKSVYAPRPSGQALAMNRTYEDAGYAPSTVGLIEAHGTGTGAGDPTEFTSMGMVFGKDNDQKQHIALGSVKSQIGHTKAAAGAAGMIRAALALHHKVLPPTLNVTGPNPKFDIQNTPIYLNTETRPWFKGEYPRRASLSAFGFGGINVHVAMEEYGSEKSGNYRIHEPYKTVLLQEDSLKDLMKQCEVIPQILNEENGDLEFAKLVQNSKDLRLNPSFPRLGFVVSTKEEAIEFFQIAGQQLALNQTAWDHPKGIYFRATGNDYADKVVALFSGQGSQYVGMGNELANAFPESFDAFAKTGNLTKTIFPIPVFSKEEKDAQQVELTKTQNAQPAIGAMSMGLYKILNRSGFKPSYAAGHSFGELTALWAAGVYDDDTFLALAQTRGTAMSAASPKGDAGTMAAVKASFEETQAAIKGVPGVKIANVNSDKQIIIAGGTAEIKAAQNHLVAKGLTVIPLPVSAAFHTEYVEHAQKPFASFVHGLKFNKPEIPVFANSTAQPYPANLNEVKTLLKEQILNPVFFKQQIENIYAAGGRVFVEFGPKGVLTNLVKTILNGKDHVAIALNPNAKKNGDLQFRQAVVQMQVLGLPIADVDPYKAPMPLPAPKTKMTVSISGNNYVSDKTKQAYTDALNDGVKISSGKTQIIEKIVNVPVERIVEVEKIIEVPVHNNLEQNQEDMTKEALQLLQQTLNTFQANQNKSLEIFERFMTDQNSQSQQLIGLLSQQLDTSAQPAVVSKATIAATPVVAPTIARKVIHSNGNGHANGNGHSNGNGSVAIAPPAPKVVSTPVAAPVSTGGGMNADMQKALMEVVSEKTGYPAEMLELEMDMEADLGIDSIKRVEIFGALTSQYPSMSGINPNDLTELRTLGEIVTYVSAKAGGSTTAAAPAPTPVAVQQPVSQPVAVAAPTSNGAVNSDMQKALMEVVSEKTGYPAEMLELEMDMEADLGIDSIKRVEIFGALTSQYPSMSGINPNDLTELRTLGEIVDYVSSKAGGSASVAVAAPTPVVVQQPVSQPVATPVPVAASNGAADIGMQKALMDVVSEKTGYPAEMLELEMDMEADLGIDSIKRVEIFGALTSQYPSMSGINPNDLTELRTLGEIVTYVSSKKG